MKSKKLSLFLVLFVFIAAVMFGCLYIKAPKLTFADTKSPSLEEYTDSDELLNINGDSSNKTIEDFATEVNNLDEGDEVEDLIRVVPIEYVRFIEDDYVFQYSGREYGFFVFHHKLVSTKLIDFVLINFTYEYNDVHCYLTIKLLLQVTLQYNNDNGSETWTIFEEKESKAYYIANPRFASFLQNENSLNYGDQGYSKKDDMGTIIEQANLYYNGIVTIKDGVTQDEGLMIAQSVATGLIDLFFNLIPGGNTAGAIYGTITDITDILSSVDEATGYKVVELNQGSDGQVFYKSRAAQEQEPESVPFTRCIATSSTNDILLTDDSSSYIACDTIINDSNSRSRINQVVQFDILQTSEDSPTKNKVYMNNVDDNGKIIPFVAYRENILFTEMEPYFNISGDNIDGKSVPVYLLPEGEQTITISPKYSGNYSFSVPSNAQFSINNTSVNNNQCYLEGGVKYTIKLSNSLTSQKIISELTCRLADEISLGNNTLSLKGNATQIVKILPNKDGFYEISLNSLNAVIVNGDILSGNKYSVHFENGVTKYLLLKNNSSQNIDLRLTVSEPQLIGESVQQSFSAGKYLRKFINSNDYTSRFKLTFSGSDNTNFVLVSNSDDELESTPSYINGNSVYTFALSPLQECYVYFDFSSSTEFKIEEDDSQWVWVIDGRVYVDNIIELARADEYEFYMGWVDLDGSVTKVEVNYDSLINDADKKYIKVIGQTITICANTQIERIGEDGSVAQTTFYIASKACYPSLTVKVVKNEIKTLYLYKNLNKLQGATAIEVEKGQPNIFEQPEAAGYTFNGYYSSSDNISLNNYYSGFIYKDSSGRVYELSSGSSNPKPSKIIGGSGIKYFNSDMKLIEEFEQIENNTYLYACWVPNMYKVTFDKNGGTGGADYAYYFYSCQMRGPDYPSKELYWYDHYKGPDGKMFFVVGPGVSMHPYYSYSYLEDVTFVAQWRQKDMYVDLDIVSKQGGTWTIEITSHLDEDLTVYYNSKMCNYGDAENWTGLKDVKKIVLEAFGSTTIKISENWFATTIAVSWVIDGTRYISFADQLSTNGSLSIHHSTVQA